MWLFKRNGPSGFSYSSTAEEVTHGIDGSGLTAIVTGTFTFWRRMCFYRLNYKSFNFTLIICYSCVDFILPWPLLQRLIWSSSDFIDIKIKFELFLFYKLSKLSDLWTHFFTCTFCINHNRCDVMFRWNLVSFYNKYLHEKIKKNCLPLQML